MLPDLAIVLVAAGASTRMGFPKLWADLAGKPLLAYAIEFAEAACPAEMVVVVGSDRLMQAQQIAACATITAGGPRRRDSVSNGISRCSAAWVAVHDAARAFAPPDLYRKGFVAAQQTGAAIPVLALKDTLKRVHDGYVLETLPRVEHALVQTPQVFRRELLQRALAASNQDVTDEATLVERLGVQVATFPGDERAFKVTTPLDFELARLHLQQTC